MVDGSIHFVDNFAFDHKPSYSLTKYYENLAKELSKSNMYAD